MFGRSRLGSIVLDGRSRPGRVGQSMSEAGTGTVLVSEGARSPAKQTLGSNRAGPGTRQIPVPTRPVYNAAYGKQFTTPHY
jgi:hypothetical protein